ncbi:hypothetical protein AK830_g11440, partial [Neonectria ditissima]
MEPPPVYLLLQHGHAARHGQNLHVSKLILAVRPLAQVQHQPPAITRRTPRRPLGTQPLAANKLPDPTPPHLALPARQRNRRRPLEHQQAIDMRATRSAALGARIRVAPLKGAEQRAQRRPAREGAAARELHVL